MDPSSSGTFGASDSFAGGGRIPARASGGPVMVGARVQNYSYPIALV